LNPSLPTCHRFTVSLRYKEEAAGFPLVRPLAGRLAEYEASGQPMAEFMPRLLDAF
jgi:hypothetical protein